VCADVYVREMARSDLPRVTEIDQALSGTKRFPTWPFSFDVYWREYKPEICFVAEAGGTLEGFIVGCLVVEEHNRSILNLRHSDRPRPYSQVGWIDMIGVHPDSQHIGTGRRLVEAFCRQCSTANVAMRAVAGEDDLRLRSFLEAAGFRARAFVVYEKDAQGMGRY